MRDAASRQHEDGPCCFSETSWQGAPRRGRERIGHPLVGIAVAGADLDGSAGPVKGAIRGRTDRSVSRAGWRELWVAGSSLRDLGTPSPRATPRLRILGRRRLRPSHPVGTRCHGLSSTRAGRALPAHGFRRRNPWHPARNSEFLGFDPFRGAVTVARCMGAVGLGSVLSSFLRAGRAPARFLTRSTTTHAADAGAQMGSFRALARRVPEPKWVRSALSRGGSRSPNGFVPLSRAAGPGAQMGSFRALARWCSGCHGFRLRNPCGRPSGGHGSRTTRGTRQPVESGAAWITRPDCQRAEDGESGGKKHESVIHYRHGRRRRAVCVRRSPDPSHLPCAAFPLQSSGAPGRRSGPSAFRSERFGRLTYCSLVRL
jgi:hypothetical protein